MHTILMQELGLFRGPQGSIATLTQPATDWVDLTGYTDVVAYLDAKQTDNGGGTSVQLAYQTSGVMDEGMFQTVATATGLGNTVSVTVMLKDALTVPLGRWLRWQLTTTGVPTTGPWHCCFRILLCCNPKGSKRKMVHPAGSIVQSPVPGIPLHMQPGAYGAGSGAPTAPRMGAPAYAGNANTRPHAAGSAPWAKPGR